MTDQGVLATDKITIRYEPSGRCFWHIDCKAQRHAPPMCVGEDDAEKRRTIICCTACNEAGYYPHGAVGDVCCERVAEGVPACDIPDNELPGMWARSDFEGGQDEMRGPDWKRSDGVNGTSAPQRKAREVPPGKWTVDMPDGTYGRMPGDPPGPASVHAVIGGYVYDVEPRTGRLIAVEPPTGFRLQKFNEEMQCTAAVGEVHQHTQAPSHALAASKGKRE